MALQIYSVPEISCEHCKDTLERAVGGMPGVQSAVVDVPARTLSVDGDVGEAAVRASIEEAGYDVAGVTSPGDHA